MALVPSLEQLEAISDLLVECGEATLEDAAIVFARIRNMVIEPAIEACENVSVGDGDLDPVDAPTVRENCVQAVRALGENA